MGRCMRWAMPLLLAIGGCTSSAPDGDATDARTGAALADPATPAPDDARLSIAAPATVPDSDAEVANPTRPHGSPGHAPGTKTPVAFRCEGADPAWTLTVGADGGTLAIEERTLALTGALKVTANGAWTWLGVPDDAPAQSVALLLVPGQCFPADGGLARPYLAELGLVDGRQVTGCCAPAAVD